MEHEIEKLDAAKKKKKKKTEHKKHGHINWCGYKRKQYSSFLLLIQYITFEDSQRQRTSCDSKRSRRVCTQNWYEIACGRNVSGVRTYAFLFLIVGEPFGRAIMYGKEER